MLAIASEIGQKMTPASDSVLRKVVATDTLSNTASTAMLEPSTPARIARSFSGMPVSRRSSAIQDRPRRGFRTILLLGAHSNGFLVIDARMLDACPMGLLMPSHASYAFRRHASIQDGSCFRSRSILWYRRSILGRDIHFDVISKPHL